MNSSLEEKLITLAIEEDIGSGDHTSLACFPEDIFCRAHLLIKEQGILAGVKISIQIYKQIDPGIKIHLIRNDGDQINSGDIAFTVSGPSLSILKSERLVLNFMQRMSGIATLTKKYTDRLKGLDTKILDTRKTTPGMRYFEKMAVKIGGRSEEHTSELQSH